MSFPAIRSRHRPASIGSAAGTAVLTGTSVPSITETEVVTGGETIIITLSGDTWVSSGATFDAERQAIIDGITASSSPANGWNAVVVAGQGVAGVVRTSDTVVTITLDAFATYDISSNETITCVIPASAVVLASPITATPTFTATAVAAGGAVGEGLTMSVLLYRRRLAA